MFLPVAAGSMTGNDTSNTHFVQLESHSLLFRHYAFVDTKDYLADQLFIQEKVRVYFR